MKDTIDASPTKDLMTHNRVDVGIGTQSDEERMQGDEIIETTD